MVEEKISRRNYAKAAAAGVVGVVIGAAGGYYGAPKAPSETITKTETATVTEGAPQPPTTVAPPTEPVELNWIEWSGYPEIVVHDDLSTTLFRIFQETLTNVSRHASATEVRVDLQETAGIVTLMTTDNGKGITEEQISNPRSFGIRGIQERAHIMGGEVQIKGIPNQGTTVIVSIPKGGKERVE